MYLSHIKKACVLIGAPTSWYYSDTTRSVLKGLAKETCSFKVPKVGLSANDLLLVAGPRSTNSAEKLMALVCWVFLLRAASEAPDLVRTQDDGPDLDPFLPPSGRAVIGLRGGSVVLRLSRRKNKPQGDMIVRRCSCVGHDGPSNQRGKSLCATCFLWPLIRRKVAVGQRVFPEGTLGKLLPWLRAGLTAKAVSWAATELENKGGPKAHLRQVGSWTFQNAAKIYLYLVQPKAEDSPGFLAGRRPSL